MWTAGGVVGAFGAFGATGWYLTPEPSRRSDRQVLMDIEEDERKREEASMAAVDAALQKSITWLCETLAKISAGVVSRSLLAHSERQPIPLC